jgi:hypothetical protein
MGEVHRALDARLGLEVATKVLPRISPVIPRHCLDSNAKPR